ncbi:MAG: Ig-like domain-containing protein, partial [Terracidiphilus sp.]
TFYTLSGGAYSGSISTLPGGTYNIWGQYGGDTSNAESSSTPVSITVSPESSGIYFALRSPTGTFTSSSTPGTSVDYGTQLNLSAQVAPSSVLSTVETCTTSCPTYTMPTGTVQFKDGSTALNTALINAEGDAEYNAPFSVGAHSVTASYAGDNSYKASTASAIAFTVVKDTPTIVLGASVVDSSNNDLVNGPGQPTVLTVQLENTAQYNAATSKIHPVPIAAPTGTVTLSSSLSGFSGTAPLSSATDPSTGAVQGVATYTVPAGSVSGSYSVSVTYNPGTDPNYNSTSQSYTIPIETTSGDGGLNSTIAATMSGSISPTTSVTISGTVTGQSGKAAPTGALYVYSSGNYPTGVDIVAGSGDSSTFSITLNSQTLFQGSNQITLQYIGDTNYNPSAYVLSSPIVNSLSDFTLIPQSSIVPISVSGGASSGTATINLASVNGFSGAVNLTCTAAAGVTCSIAPTAPTLSSGASTTSTLTINATAATPSLSYNVLVTGTDSTGKYVHTTAVEAVVTGSSVTASFGLTASPASLTITQGATAGNTSTITVSPVGSFTATVDLTCAVTTTIVGPAGVATCSMASPSVASGSGTDVVTVTTSGTTSPGPYTVTITGISGQITQTAVVNVTVNTTAPATFSMSSNPTSFSVTAGAITGNTTLVTITGANGFSGTVDLTCAISPTAASDPATCSLAAASVQVSPTQIPSVVVTVNTTAATTSQNEMKKLYWPSAGGATLALLLFFGLPKRRRNWLAMLGLLAFFVAAAGMGCGGGGGGGCTVNCGGGNTGTTPGTYTLTVTGTSGTTVVTLSPSVTVTVN